MSAADRQLTSAERWMFDRESKAVAFNIRRLRKDAGLTMTELARRLDVSKQYVGLVEIGESVPSLLMMVRVAVALGLESTTPLFTPLPASSEARRNVMSSRRVSRVS